MKGDARLRGARRGLGNLTERGPRRLEDGSGRAGVVAVAAALFAATFALRIGLVDETELISVLCLIPIAMLAVEFGVAAGLLAALVASTAALGWELVGDVELSAVGHAVEVAAFFAVAIAGGAFSSGARRARSIQNQLIESAPDALVGVDEDGGILVVNAQAERLFGYDRQELTGKPIELLVPEDSTEHEPGYVRSFFESPRTRPINVAVGLRGRHRLGHEFPCEISLSALETGSGTIALAAIRDVTERTRAEEELRRAFRRLEATTDIARAIGGETELDTVLDAIVERGRALVEAKGLVVMLVEGDGLVVAATAGNVESGIHGMRVPLAGLTATVVRSLQPQRVDTLKGVAGVPGPEGRVDTSPSAAIVVPLEFRGSALGVVAAFDRRDGPEFSEEDERLLLAFAASAATAVATARDVAQDRLRRTIEAAELERKRWARELHDETLQGLGALRVALASALRGGSEKSLRAVVATAVDEIAEEIRSLRSLISELRPAALDELGLAAALETLSERSASLVGLEMETDVRVGAKEGEDQGRLAPELESTIYRLVQEALSNVAKHARAERVSLSVTETNGYVDVLITDDGVGFDPDAPNVGFGLQGMRERVAMAGGTIEVRSAPGRGTSIEARLPTGDPGPGGLAVEQSPLEGVADQLGAGRAP
ncbi:MAG TPA: PAS domain S-box protein [Solirubrobacterales bacterium]